ncbi:Accessory gene regulator B [Coprococcus sp. ART55/1]|nr:Accessory gene regulator B [Coprococcus sp. ART55/1]
MKTWYGCTAVTVLFYIVVLACGENIILSSKLQNSLWVSEIVVIALFAPIPSKQRPKYNQHRKNMIKARGIAGVLIIGAVSLGVKSYNNYIVWIWLLQIINRRDKRL